MAYERPSRYGLVIDGMAADFADYPFAVYIRTSIPNSSDKSCIGAIITNEYIIAKSICVINPETKKPLPLEKVGVYYGNSSRSKQKPATLVDIIYDDGYSNTNYTNSVALLKIEPLDFSSLVSRIPIYNDILRLDDKLASIGWGGVNLLLDSTETNTLLSYNQKIGNDYQCRQALDNYQGPNGYVICTYNSVYTENRTCDGGGIDKLLLKRVKQEWSLVGISIDGEFKKTPNRPKNYTLSTRRGCGGKFTAMRFIRINSHLSSFSDKTELDPANFTVSNKAMPDPNEGNSANEGSSGNNDNSSESSSGNSSRNSDGYQDDSSNDHDQESNSLSNIQNSASNGLSTGAKIGIIIGSVALLLIIVSVSYILRRIYKKSRVENIDRQHYENGVRHVAKEFGLL